MTVSMALVDFVPVILFAISAVMILRALYHDMSKGAFALLAGGLLMSIAAGCFKATWKLLYALNVCDFAALNQAFFPMQATGFLLSGIAMIAFVFFPQNEKGSRMMAVAAPVLYDSSMIFVIALVLGTFGLCGGLALHAGRRRRAGAAVLFMLALVLLLGMGYLSSRDFTDPKMNWIGEGVNIAAQVCLLLGVRGIRKA